MMAAAGLAARGEPRLPTPLAILGYLAAVPAVGAVLSLVIAAPLGFVVFSSCLHRALRLDLGREHGADQARPIEEL
jgi:hypothetical protein